MASLALDRIAGLSAATAPRRWERRDAAWFSRVYTETFDSAYRFAFSMLRDPDRSEDVVADAYVKAWRNRDGLREGTSVRSWILSITRNCAMDALAARRPEVHLDPAREPEDPGLDAFHRELTPAELEYLQKAIGRLTPEQRAVVELRFYEGLSHEEVAKRMGKEANAVRALQFRALNRLRKSLEASGVR